MKQVIQFLCIGLTLAISGGYTVTIYAQNKPCADGNAAGQGWDVDLIPLNNTDDYLPTSSPNVWQAKAESAAAGKMDMLSVLPHEYGHVVDLERSAEGR